MLNFINKDLIEVELFSNFLTQKYDTRDLVFYLYVRCLVEKELDIKFSSYGKINPIITTDSRNLKLTLKTCKKIATIFFEQDENELNNFMNLVQSKLNENFDLNKDNKIQATVFMSLLLEEFHTSKNTGVGAKSMEAFEHQINEHEESKKFEDDVSPELVNPKGNLYVILYIQVFQKEKRVKK